MSAPNLRRVLTPRAQRDVAGLTSFSERQWGRDQRLRYRARIERALGELARFPDLGRPRDDVAPGVRAHRVGEHVIYYQRDDQTLLVIRILHVRMDLTGKFAEP